MRCFRLAVFVLANVLSLSLVCTEVLAQRPGGGQGGGQGGGPGGGRGMGFGGRGMMMGGRGGVMDLLRMEEVQKELKLTDDQKKTLTDEGAKMGEAMRSMFSDFRPGGEMTDEMRKKMEENGKKMAEMAKEMEKKLETILDPDQQDRLTGLLIQRSGVRAVPSSELLCAALEVTDDQKTKFAEVEKQNGDEMRKAFEKMRSESQGGDEDPQARGEKMRKAMEEMNKAAEERMTAVLTGDQKTKMESLKGAKFEFPAPQFGGFGGPGGPGGPGGRPGRGNRPGGGGDRAGGGN